MSEQTARIINMPTRPVDPSNLTTDLTMMINTHGRNRRKGRRYSATANDANQILIDAEDPQSATPGNPKGHRMFVITIEED